MRLSFKIKIALLSLAVSGTLLTAFGVLFFTFTFRSGIDRMDQEIRTLAESSLRGPRKVDYWENFENSLQFIYGDSTPDRVALYVLDVRSRTSYQSENAPTEIASLVPTRSQSLKRQEGSANAFIQEFDFNEDGQISMDEFDGPTSDFRQLDINRDQFISLKEASAQKLHPMPPPRPQDPQESEKPIFQTLESSNGNWRVGIFQSPEMTVLMAMDMDIFYRDIKQFRVIFFTTVPAGLILLALAGWFLADRAMRPVAIIAKTAEGITSKDLDQRIPMVGKDVELERLVTVCNHMLDRLEKGYRQAVRFSADAAHELQTPLTILQGELDNAIQTAEIGSAEQQRYSELLQEVSGLKGIIQKLLLLAHADEGRLKLNMQPMNFSELLSSAIEDLEIMAPELTVSREIPANIEVTADNSLLQQAVRNMTSNAAKYTTPGGHLILKLEQIETQVHFTLSNTAAPIPEEDRSQLFERFHRVEKSRTTAGSGLGLSLAREIARAHQGELRLNPYREGMVSFTLIIPAEVQS
jgi:signal transduction histidine kinase